MPFDASFNDTYQLGIKSASENASAYCERLDEQIFDESMLARIYNQIAKADLIVADMTGRNPNVFYEVGYAHALGKTVILLTQNANDIPFDLKHFSHIVYGGSIVTLRDELTKRIRYHLANPDRALSAELENLEFSIKGVRIEPDACIEVPISWGNQHQKIVVGVTNPENVIVNWENRATAIVLPEDFPPYYPGLSPQLPDERYLHALGTLGALFPGQWKTLEVDVLLDDQHKYKGEMFRAELRIFTPYGWEATAFYLKFV